MKNKIKITIITLVIFNGIFAALIPVNNIYIDKESLQSSAGDWDNIFTRGVGDFPMGVFIGDANNDGYDDIATANNWADSVSILCWNQTTGDWDMYILAAGHFSRGLFIGDANNDGQNDIATANYGDHTVSIFLWNKTSGDWDAGITRAVGNNPNNVFIGDANNDGQNDIVVTNSVSDTVSILCWNHTSGSWDMYTRAVGEAPDGVFIGDANNDGQNDIVVANSLDDTVSILCWNHTRIGWDTYTRAVGDGPDGVFVGDANNDGQNDIATADWGGHTVSILCWNQTIDDWDARINLAVIDSLIGISIGDANNDGENDIVVCCANSDKVRIFLWNNTSGYWDAQITRSVGDGPRGIFIGDANNDGQNDLVTANSLADTVSILCWNQPKGDWDPQIIRTTGDKPTSTFLGDANNDGENDIVVANKNDNTISILCWNQIAGDWDTQITRAVGINPSSVFIGDANNDGENDIVVANEQDNNVSILLWNYSIGDWDPEINRVVGSNPTSVFVGDANNDGENDIVVANRQDNNVSILLWNYSIGDWDPEINRAVGGNPSSVFVGDADNDGENDIVAANGLDNNVSILLWNYSIGNWDPEVTRAVGDNPNSVFVGDANNNGKNDIVVVNYNDNTTSILCWNYTAGNWDAQKIQTIGGNPISVFIGDANNDGENDIVIANSNENTTSILCWNHTTDSWELQITQAVGGNPSSVFVGDANNDGKNDIIVSNSIDNTISIIFSYLGSPKLETISPSIDNDGFIYLNWIDVDQAIIYYIYRNDSYINTVDNLTPIASVLESNYTDTLLPNGTYFYVLIAGDNLVNSTISNCENVTVILSLDPPILDTITPNVNNDGIVNLNWNATGEISKFYIYRNGSYINSVINLIPIASVSESNYTDILITDGNYFFVVIAGNRVVNSSISNCENVTVILPLDPPILDSITPSIDNDGIIHLDWNDIDRATIYYVYRSDSYINSVISLTPIASILESNYTDTLLINGTYYYVIVAGNIYVNSSISNCENVIFTLDPPVLDPITPSIDNDGIIHLDWNDVSGATIYNVYRSNSYINSVTSLTPIASILESNYTDTLLTNGTYYYMIVAGNAVINSSISNCENVIFTLDPPVLDLITPSIDNDGIINLNWNDVSGATIYNVYRSNSYINSVTSLTPIASILESNYTDTLLTNGTYYYVIVAGNAVINSSISNCENVIFTLDSPVLDLITPSVDNDGIINLDWNDVSGATIYYVYRSNSYINSVTSLTPIASILESNYTDTLLTNGTYYYVIVAGNVVINSSISNCENVIFTLDPPVLDLITPSIDNDGIIHLDWNDVSGATIYYVYRSNSYINSVTSLTPIASILESNYTDTLLTNETYFYVIMAGNAVINSSISNCENIALTLDPPVLDLITPSVDNDGIINLDWNDVSGAKIYYVYRSDSYINSVISLTPIASILESNYTDTLLTNGTYFYVIVAGNVVINSSISNCENVIFTLDPPVLDPITPSIDNDGIIHLDWNDVSGATIYYVYRSNSYINSVTSLTPIASIMESNYTDSLLTNGTYFYVIVAGNAIISSSISNCENVNILIEYIGVENPFPIEIIIIIIVASASGIGVGIVIIFLKKRRRSNINK